MRRKHYAGVYCIGLALLIAIAYIQRTSGTTLGWLTIAVIAATVPASVRRLHDIGYSGWIIIGVLVIPLAYLLLLFAPGEPGSNAYGINPKLPTA